MPEGWSWGPWRTLGPWGSSWSNPWISLLSLRAHIPWGPWEALWPSIPWSSVLTGITRLAVPSWGAVLPWRTRVSWGALRPRDRVCVGAVHPRAYRALGTDRARWTLSSWLPLLPLQASRLQAAAWAQSTLVPLVTRKGLPRKSFML